MIANVCCNNDYNNMNVNKEELARLLSRRISAAIIQTLDQGEVYTDLLLFRLAEMLGLKITENAYKNLEEGNPIAPEDIIDMEPRIRYTSVIPLQEGYSYYNRGYRGARYIIAAKELDEVEADLPALESELKAIVSDGDSKELKGHRNKKQNMLISMISWCKNAKTTYNTEKTKFMEELKEIDKREASLRDSARSSEGLERDELNMRADDAAADRKELEPPAALSGKELEDRIKECCMLFDLADECFKKALERNTKSATIISYRSLVLFIKAKLMHILGMKEERDKLLEEAVNVFEEVEGNSPNYFYLYARKHEIYKWWCFHETDEEKRLSYYKKVEECRKGEKMLSETWFFDDSLSSLVNDLLLAAMKKYPHACLFRTSDTIAGSFVVSFYYKNPMLESERVDSKKCSQYIKHLPILTDLAGNYYVQIRGSTKVFASFKDIVKYFRESGFYICSKRIDP